MRNISTINDVVTLTAKDKFLRNVILDALINLSESKKLGKDRDVDILYDILSGRSTKDVAEAYGLTVERIRSIAHETLKRTLDAYNSQQQEIEHLRAERDRLSLEVKMLKEDIDEMKKQISEDKRNIDYPADIPWNLPMLLETKVKDSNLSNRAKNCFCEYEFTDTVGGLMQFTETDILKFRNIGTKVRDEVRAWLRSYGVDFGYTYKKAARLLSEERIEQILRTHKYDKAK